jgi:predicted dehydrogenase
MAHLIFHLNVLADPSSIRGHTLVGMGRFLGEIYGNEQKWFDAYLKVIQSGVDVLLLCTPPAFRPDHLIAAIDAGKHVFCEKPVAVDAPGVRKVLMAAKKAKDKKLALLSGFCLRYDFPNRAIFGKVLNGDIGDMIDALAIAEQTEKLKEANIGD